MKKLFSLLISLAMIIACFAAFITVSSAANGQNQRLSLYTSDGLAAMYLAELNTGNDYDAKSTEWRDVNGNADLTITVPNDEKNYFKDDYYQNTATRVMFPDQIRDIISSGEFTTEIVLGECEFTGTTWGTLLNCSNDQYSLFYRASDNSVFIKNTGNQRPSFANAKEVVVNSTITVTFKVGGEVCLYLNGELQNSASAAAAINADNFYFGHDDPSKSHTTQYKAIRFYTKALSSEEVANNYAADIYVEEPETEDSKEPSESGKIVKINDFENIKDFKAGSCIIDTENVADGQYNIDCYDWTDSLTGGKMQIVDGKGVNASAALGISRTETGNIWSLLYTDEISIAGTEYLTLWVDFTGVDFRKACFGVIGSAEDGHTLYRTDEADVKDVIDCPFFMLKDGNWVEFKHGGDGCFGTAQDTPMLDFKGYIAVPLNTFYPWDGGRSEAIDPETTKISGIFFYFDYDSADYAGKEFYFDRIAFVDNYNDADKAFAETPGEEPSSEKPTTETSDNGIIALVVIASMAVAGAVAAKKFR